MVEITGVKDTNLNYHRLFLDVKRLLPDYGIVEKYFEAPVEMLSQKVSDAQKQNIVREDLDAKSVALQLIATVEGSYIMLFYLSGDKFRLDDKKLDQMADIVWRGISQ